MKNARKKTIVFLSIAVVVLFLSNCKLDDQVLLGNNATGGGLVSQLVTTAPTIDGTIDPMWENSTPLEFEAVVPDPGGDVFRSYVGHYYKGTIRSAYDAQNIYFLAEWEDPTESLARQPWYFNPDTKKWATESGLPTFAANGAITRPAFGEDKFALLWNVNNSVAGWNNATCYKSCHTGMSAADGYSRHRTNSPNETVDMWHWKANRNNVVGMVDDQYQDSTFPNGRKSDDKTAGGDVSNSQMLAVTETGTMISVPKYFIPNKSNYYWILKSEIDAGTAKLITAVDSNGVLSYNGGVIDPTADVAFQRDGAGIGAKVIPGITTSAFEGSRGDITCVGIYTGKGWVLEFKRALKTSDEKGQDVDFSSLEDQHFGLAVFNNIGAAHAIEANLLLKFGK